MTDTEKALAGLRSEIEGRVYAARVHVTQALNDDASISQIIAQREAELETLRLIEAQHDALVAEVAALTAAEATVEDATPTPA